MSRNRSTVSRPNGAFIRTYEGGREVHGDSVQCVHCGMHWEWIQGSGKTSGFCYHCMGPICGPKCQVCKPLEKQLEDLSKATNGARAVLI